MEECLGLRGHMSVKWIDVVRSAVMWGIFVAMVFLGLKYMLRFFEELERSREGGVYDDPEIKRKSSRLSIMLYNLVGLELLLGATAIWAIWIKLPGAGPVIFGTIFVVVQIGVSVVERRWRTLMTKNAGQAIIDQCVRAGAVLRGR